MPPRNQVLDDDERFHLYEQAVQCPAFEIAFFEKVFEQTFSRAPVTLREDFCGSGAVAREFVLSHPSRRAWGVDLDRATLEFARQRARACEIDEDRLSFEQRDVRDPWNERPALDVIAAENFSWCAFHSRAQLRDYFASVFESFSDDGILVLDLFGGAAREREGSEDTRDVGPCVFKFRQSRFDPIQRRTRFHIDFTLRGQTFADAFVYDWRLWTLPETKDLLEEVGFVEVKVFWEARDVFGAATSRYAPQTEAQPREKWVAYVVGVHRGSR